MKNIILYGGLLALLAGCESNALSVPHAPKPIPATPSSLKMTNDLPAIEALEKKIEITYNINLVITATEEKSHRQRGLFQYLQRLNEILADIHPGLFDALQTIAVDRNPLYLNTVEKSGQLAYIPETGTLIVSPAKPLDLDLVVRPLVHMKVAQIPGFHDQWTDIVRVDPSCAEYRNCLERGIFPALGFINRDAASSYTTTMTTLPWKPVWKDDPAEYVAEIYRGYETFTHTNPHDPRYRAKADFLALNRLISPEQHQKTVDLLGSDQN